ncbi:hypothetical protein CLAFUW4_08432 [Fulvia fulva]|uniref:Uncharacterized protein n=1 Tax=Passalora fulva TaxID=5499 RepID=A0A9Q8P6R9_PASFU|nr:uncharacterized protein CLAFUR5_08536 [Fulvia fulva]KAK4628871.1 hypothetical protein CLAFUR4_08437 [Fulvia fulva]KAK4630330.1 hypothetical protein CLAFUR0_08432 [Fulvia fulva]UJO15420.1 hypothetical protein CLAFUR5_08536 [Fulvia fulva]WPV13034.1 hypothetical protein CLAFUW4_08432 [Fulvia fulva]WPV27693.1 hypothetical protein CLAFUW7_08432 [Fulvia fulva]
MAEFIQQDLVNDRNTRWRIRSQAAKNSRNRRKPAQNKGQERSTQIANQGTKKVPSPVDSACSIEQSMEAATDEADGDARPGRTAVLARLKSEPNNIHMRRSHLRDALVNTYYSTTVVHMNRHFLDAFHDGAPKGPVFDAARDALSLIHLGTQSQDQQLVVAGQKLHCIALNLLRTELGKAGATHDDRVLGAVHTIAQCEMYSAISGKGKGWQLHMAGLYYIFQHRGPHGFKTPFARAILHNIRQAAITYQLVERRSTFLSSPQWLSAIDYGDSAAVELTRIALRLSAVLEEANQVIREGHSNLVLSRHLLTKMSDLEHNLVEWLSEKVQNLRGWVPPQLVSIKEFRHLEKNISDPKVFPEVFTFTGLPTATSHVYVFVCFLSLWQCLLDVSVAFPHLNIDPTAVAREAEQCADDLCRTLPYISMPEHGFAGVIASTAPLHFASVWFERKKMLPRLQWCNNVRDYMEQTGPTELNLRRPILTWWMLPGAFD